ncbi:glutamate ABC transporter substrate-binding protein [Kitasatospora sp. LaBMicrA B282]|uniref:glutamate ABC transporter substrate-binding protein n=1 Tax=Kitasatospora sp. LaBMicrA B282 TaxID=3420949 RepID=UPI003D0A4E2C
MMLGGSVRVLPLAAVVLAALTTAAPAGPRNGATSSVTPSPAPAHAGRVQQAADTSCDPNRSPYPPPSSNTASGPTIAAIKARGRLNVGVDLNDYRWGFRGPDGKPEGFDIDIVHAIAQSLLGDPNAVNYFALDDEQRIPRLDLTSPDPVDLVVHTMTITCQRMQQVDFSTVYFNVVQRVLVPRANNDPGESVDKALQGKRVCAASGSISEDDLKQNMHGAKAIVPVDQELDCLVQMQLGKADAALTDDSIAYSLAAQDPEAEVVAQPLDTTPEPYGIAVSKGAPDLTAWVNKVLEDYRKGPWQASYDKWLKPYVPGAAEATPPPAEYQHA